MVGGELPQMVAAAAAVVVVLLDMWVVVVASVEVAVVEMLEAYQVVVLVEEDLKAWLVGTLKRVVPWRSA